MLYSDYSFIPDTTPVFAHPLLKNLKPTKRVIQRADDESASSSGEASVNQKKFLDPLGVASNSNLLENGLSKECNGVVENGRESGLDDATNRLLNNTLKLDAEEQQLSLDPELLGFRPWRELREEILAKFTTKDHLSMESSFLSTKGQSFHEKKRALNGDVLQTVIKFYDLSQEVYVKKLSDLKKVLCHKWKQEKRIECIKLITEAARLLSTTSAPQFYPAQFVYITDLLDFFGSVVYDRLLQRAKKERIVAGLPPLPHNFLIHDILEQTRITARNWFGKIGGIRELIPRIYVECCLLQCMHFMDQSAISANVMRLCVLAKSVQHPLISSYVRCYICRVAMRLNPADRAPHWRCLNDWMQTYTQQPTSLLWPAMQYIVQCVSYNAVSYNDLSPLWEYCRLPDKRGAILCSMLHGLSHVYLAEHALEACRLVTGSDQVTGDELCALGSNLLRMEVGESVRKPLLKSVWKCIVRLVSLKAYVACCDVWVEFVAKYFTINELHIILENLIKKLLPDKKYEFYYDNLLSIMRKMFASTIDSVAVILSMDIFPQFIDIFREEGVRQQSSLLVLNAVVRRHETGEFSDINLAHQVLDVSKRLNESIGVSSAEAEVDKVSNLIQGAMDRFELKSDPEQALSFYVACRAGWLNNDRLQRYTILRIMSLGLFVVRTVKFSTSRSTFVQACIANLFITIPSLRDPLQRLELAIQSAHLSLASLAFLQVDAFVQFCLDTFRHLPPSCFHQFHTTGVHFLALLVQVPPMDEEDPLANIAAFLKAVNSYPWPSHSNPHKSGLLLSCLQHILVLSTIGSSTNTSFQLQQQFQWTSALTVEKGDLEVESRCYELAEQVIVLLKSSLTEDSSDRMALSMGFVEVVSIFAKQELLGEETQSLAKDCFRRCKKCPQMANRVKLLKRDGS